MPDPNTTILAAVQAAISGLLTTYEPEFLRLGHRLYLSFAVIVIVWHGIQTMFTSAPLPDRLFDFAKLLLVISFGYAMIAFYESPLPGIGVSFSNLVTDQTAYLSGVLDASAVESVDAHLSDLWSRFMVPDTWGVLSNLVYWLLMILIMGAKLATIAVVAFGLIASAVCALLGPLFVPFFILPALNFLFWGWFKSFLQYSFIPVVAIAYLMVGERFVFRFVTEMPALVTSEQFLLYAGQAFVVVGMFVAGILWIPSLTSSIFSGHSHGSNGGGFMMAFVRRGR